MRFPKAEEQNFSSEIFRVAKVTGRRPQDVYFLKDLKGTHIDGQFYRDELTPVHIIERTVYKIYIIQDTEVTKALTYCTLISAHNVGYSTVRCMPTFVFSSTASCHHEFRNMYYVTVEQRRFQDVRIEFLTTEGLDITFEDSMTPTNVVLHFRKNYK